MDVLIYLTTTKDPIEANIPEFNSIDFAAMLNGNIMFISLGGNVLNRNLIQMILPKV